MRPRHRSCRTPSSTSRRRDPGGVVWQPRLSASHACRHPTRRAVSSRPHRRRRRAAATRHAGHGAAGPGTAARPARAERSLCRAVANGWRRVLRGGAGAVAGLARRRGGGSGARAGVGAARRRRQPSVRRRRRPGPPRAAAARPSRREAARQLPPPSRPRAARHRDPGRSVRRRRRHPRQRARAQGGAAVGRSRRLSGRVPGGRSVAPPARTRRGHRSGLEPERGPPGAAGRRLDAADPFRRRERRPVPARRAGPPAPAHGAAAARAAAATGDVARGPRRPGRARGADRGDERRRRHRAAASADLRAGARSAAARSRHGVAPIRSATPVHARGRRSGGGSPPRRRGRGAAGIVLARRPG